MKIIAILPFVLVPIFTFSQQKKQYQFDYQVIYQMTYQTDSNNINSLKKEFLELLTNESITLFRSIKAGKLDSAMYSEISKGNTLGPSVNFVMENYTTVNYKIVKEKLKNRILTFDVPGDVKSSGYYMESIDNLHWVIKNDTLKISGLQCQKAELDFGNRKWTAWFATEIPIADGPYKFAGLPGLVIQISDQRKFWNFSMLSLNKVQKEAVINFDKRLSPVYMEKKAFFKQKRNYLDNMLQMDEASGLIIGFSSPQDRDMMQKNQKANALKNNNWIELYKP